MPKNKAFNQIQKDLKQKKKTQSNLQVEDQGQYVDSSRNIAVTMDSKELAKALKYFDKEEVFNIEINSNIFGWFCFKDLDDINKGIVNSHLYKKQALHFSTKKKFDEAKKYLSLGRIHLTKT